MDPLLSVPFIPMNYDRKNSLDSFWSQLKDFLMESREFDFMGNTTKNSLEGLEAQLEIELQSSEKNIEIPPSILMIFYGSPPMTLLHACAYHNKPKLLKIFLDHPDIDPNLPLSNWSPLHLASWAGNDQIVQLLLDHPKIDVNQLGNTNHTALHYASLHGHQGAIKLLLADPRVDLNKELDNGEAPLHCMCRKGYTDIAKLLLADSRIEINKKDRSDCTALYLASSQGRKEIIELLLCQSNIDVNQMDDSGQSALSIAGVGQFKEVVERLLLVPQIDINIQIGGMTFSQIVRNNGWNDILQLLEECFLDVSQSGLMDQNLKKRRNIFAYIKASEWDSEFKIFSKKISSIYASLIFALTVFFCDDYLRLKCLQKPHELAIERYFTIAQKLPIELQMALSHRVYGSLKEVIPSQESERAFKEIAKSYIWID